MDGSESELERQEVKVRKGRKLKKQVCVEAGKEEFLAGKEDWIPTELLALPFVHFFTEN